MLEKGESGVELRDFVEAGFALVVLDDDAFGFELCMENKFDGERLHFSSKIRCSSRVLLIQNSRGKKETGRAWTYVVG